MQFKSLFSLQKWYQKRLMLEYKIFPKFFQWNHARLYYNRVTGRVLSYKNPQSINEKLFWLSRYWPDELKSYCADKYLVRNYLKKCNLQFLEVPLYGVYNSSAEIDFEKLPNKFVIKCNHGCQMNIICEDKSLVCEQEVKQKLDEWLKISFGGNLEPHYVAIQPKIIAEKLIDFESVSIVDYKLHCLNGEPQFFLICYNRSDDEVILKSYSLNWEPLDYLKHEGENDIPKPKFLNEMVRYARILSKPFPYVRVDFYITENEVLLSELTFTPAKNTMYYYKNDINLALGRKLRLPPKMVV